MNEQNPQSGALVPRPGDVLEPGRVSATVRLGLAPQTLDEAWKLAQNMAKSKLVPESFQEKPHDVLVAIQLGLEVGFAPMQALQSIAVINGRPSIWGDGFLALIMASEKYEDHDEYYEVDGQRVDGLTAEDLKKDGTAAVCTFRRKGKGSATTQRFTIAMAKKAELLTKKGPWQNYPDRMLKLRARSWAGRDAFPDVLRGLVGAEEAADIPLADRPSVHVVPMNAPQRLSAQAPVADAAQTPPPGTSESRSGAALSRGDSGHSTTDVVPATTTDISPGVLIKDVAVTKGEGSAKAVITDDQGVSYTSEDRSIILAAQVAMQKSYRMEITSERQGDDSVVIEINRVQQAETVGK